MWPSSQDNVLWTLTCPSAMYAPCGIASPLPLTTYSLQRCRSDACMCHLPQQVPAASLRKVAEQDPDSALGYNLVAIAKATRKTCDTDLGELCRCLAPETLQHGWKNDPVHSAATHSTAAERCCCRPVESHVDLWLVRGDNALACLHCSW